MKFQRASVIAVCLFIFATLAFAEKNSTTVSFDQPVKVAEAQLKAGDYKVVWSGSGSDVQVSFIQNGKTVATAPATLKENVSRESNAIETETAKDNSSVLLSIDMKHWSLVFAQPTTEAGN